MAPAPVDLRRLRRIEDRLLSVVPDEVEVLALAPVVPLGTHSVVAGVHQNNVLATVRGSEVAADPANGLALEAAVRRREARTRGRAVPPVRLAALQRVIRRVPGSGRFAHVGLFALATAGRDSGGLAFERRHAAEQLRLLCAALRAAGAGAVEVTATLLDPAAAPVTEAVRAALADHPDVVLAEAVDRAGGRRYHTGWCFTLAAVRDGVRVELGAGGFVDWTQRLLGNPRERLLVSTIGVDRLAGLLVTSAPGGESTPSGGDPPDS
jgi:hypothetical protein